MKSRRAVLFACLLVGVVTGLTAGDNTGTRAANLPTSAVSEDASSALARMAATLQAKAFSFRVRTIRVYMGQNGEQLHIAHEFNVLVRRPDRLLVDGMGDDGPRKLIYDGKTAVVALNDGKEYASIPVPNTIERMLQVAVGHFGVDFPLADFLTDAPDKAFLSGVTAGHEVNTVTIGGVLCRHFVFSQPPGLQLELWLENNAQSLPRRLIVVYRSLPGEPNFVAEMSNWNLAASSPDSEFTFEPPEGATRLQFGAALQRSTGVKQ
jgi:hypothetical protein